MVKSSGPASDDVTKKPNQKSEYTMDNLTDFVRCAEDPLFFMRRFMKVQEPIKGTIPFEPWPYQIRIIESFYKHRNTIALTARQMGKCSHYGTSVSRDGHPVAIGTLVPLTLRERVVAWLERKLLRLALSRNLCPPPA